MHSDKLPITNYKTYQRGKGWGQGSTIKREKMNRTRLRYDSLLKTLDRKIKIAILNMLEALMEKVSNMHEHIGNFSSETDIIQRNQMEMREILIVETLT